MSVGILILRLWMLGGSSPAFSDQDNPASFSPSLVTRALTFLYLPVFNAWLLLCPWSLSHDWQMGSVALVTSPFDLRNLASVLLYGGLALALRAGLVIKGRDGNGILLGLVLLVVPFLPATNLFFTVGFVVAERILYIPSLGYALLISIGLSRLGRLRAPCLLLLLMAFSCRTVQRNRDWESRETLFVAGLRTLPHNAKMHYNYANLQKDLGNTNLAKYHYEEAIRLWPGLTQRPQQPDATQRHDGRRDPLPPRPQGPPAARPRLLQPRQPQAAARACRRSRGPPGGEPALRCHQQGRRVSLGRALRRRRTPCRSREPSPGSSWGAADRSCGAQ
ncbi:protein O-mannosyl-transferase TMTC1-like [Penaeus japonicus]|uniref:protein O-mannosyl-transferase TMTC1-like n=1 Tax=Penaeus japonicus TaxID=27405 RepID=UPI001C70F848|nr:protein O-mannosyl-transferase TMTC1-like [Penaeus japonicus]